MSTSGVISFNMTARQVIQKAMEKAAILSPGESFKANEGATALQDLTLMLKSWQADGGLWRETEDSFVANAAETTLDPRVIAVSEARVVTGGYERPLTRWEWGDYVTLPTKTQTGTPSCYVFRKNRATTTMLLWPVPTGETIKYTAQRVIEDVATLDDDLDVPQEWLECVILNLAARLAPGYGAALSPSDAQLAADLLQSMKDMDRPASYYMGTWGR